MVCRQAQDHRHVHQRQPKPSALMPGMMILLCTVQRQHVGAEFALLLRNPARPVLPKF